MKRKLFTLLSAMVAMLLMSCNNDDKIDDELTPQEAKKVAFVGQLAEVFISSDLCEMADVAVSCVGVNHESIDLSMAMVTNGAKAYAEIPINEVSYPCALTITITITPNPNFVPELQRVYNFKYWVKGAVQLVDKEKKVMAMGGDIEAADYSITAEEDTQWNTLLNISPIVLSVRVIEQADGSLDIED